MNKKLHKVLSRSLFFIDVAYILFIIITSLMLLSKNSVINTLHIVFFGIILVLNLAFIIYNIVTLIIKR